MLRTLIPILLIFPALLLAQDNPKPGVYRVDYSLRESGSSQPRTYTLLLGDREKGSIRTGKKVPYSSGPSAFQYAEIGVNIDCRLFAATANALNLRTDFEYSQVLSEGPKTGPALPVIQQIKGSAASEVPIGQRTAVLSLDDPTGQRRYEIEVLVTAVK